jgi:ADP-ribosylglycohydrolase
MRTSSIGWLFNDLETVLQKAKEYADITHNHYEGVKGAQSISASIFLARTGKSKEEIKKYIEETFHYDLSRTLDQIRPTYKFEVSCQKSVPESIICFLESTDFVDSIRNAVSLGGDSDTMACMAGAISESFYGLDSIPQDLTDKVISILPEPMFKIIEQFYNIIEK